MSNYKLMKIQARHIEASMLTIVCQSQLIGTLTTLTEKMAEHYGEGEMKETMDSLDKTTTTLERAMETLLQSSAMLSGDVESRAKALGVDELEDVGEDK